MSGRSLSGRLMRRVLAVVGAGWLLSLAVGLGVIAHEMNELLDRGLRTQTELILALVEADRPVPPLSAGLRLRVLRADMPTPSAPWPGIGPGAHLETSAWHVMRRDSADGRVAVELGQSTGWRREELMESARAFLLLMAAVLVSAVLAVRQGTRAALRPARDFAAQMARRDAGDLSPVPAADLPAELAPIPRALNGYLGRIEALLAAERRFAADAAHELRSPIASAAAQAQLIAEAKAGPEAATRLLRAIERLGRIVERLLQLARAEAPTGLDSDRADLIAILDLLIRDRPGATIRFDDGDHDRLDLALAPDSLAILLANLIDNARDHGTGPVEIVLRPGPVLVIANPTDGPAELLGDRFARRPGSDGTGLGLSIVRALADQHGIGLSHEAGPGRMTIRLDLAALVPTLATGPDPAPG
ncbi:histidine kinase dimerization/phospho-acceptor domain-containing protein [Rhodovulum sp. MB263]|uniref:histidine kinase dimerization/phospho-acceptor domain-containing protein n=1 Tax=Rhodovulum sp. (strain MB263) TaxID=308754 RepID=UPI0009B74D5D|nr:histidine kinase dimerization/phospho-acceptor domain-containing protein [Rhodovulum sp. MB263]ARC90779.1 hypothetical protein B5V46_19085 [Rhodovulum sp. MB263]